LEKINCEVPHYAVSSILLLLPLAQVKMFSGTLWSLYASVKPFRVRGQGSHPYRATGKNIILETVF
jgi:hypothetical protein